MAEEKEDKTYNLEKRLIDFAVRIIRMAESLQKAKVANHNDRMSGSNQPYGLSI
jgi:hypothetical protein